VHRGRALGRIEAARLPRPAPQDGHRHGGEDEDEVVQDHPDRAGDPEHRLGRQEVAVDVLIPPPAPTSRRPWAIASGDEVRIEIGSLEGGLEEFAES